MKPQVEQELAHVLLSELLAYQFASPVRWIETQDVVLAEKKAERIIEIGPSATLSGMMSRTLKQNYQAYDAALSLQRQVYCYAKDRKEIYYERDPEAEAPAAVEEAAAPAASATPAAPAAAPVAAPAAPTAVAAPMDDVPLKSLQVLHTIIAVKLRKPLDKVPVSKTIRDLVGGKSTVQNEILGDLAKEFAAAPEKAEEIVISDLAEEFADTFDGKLGKHTNALISKLASSKMPGGFGLSQIRKYLQSRFGFGPGRQDAVLLSALVSEPAARLANEAAAKDFFDGIAQSYASANGLNLNAGASASAGGVADAAGPAVSAEALEAVTKDQKYLARQQLELYARYLRVDLRDGQKRYAAQKEATEVLQKELDLWLAEHGDTYAEGIVPIFAPLKARIYDSYWNWARQDCFKMFYDIIWGKQDSVDREIVARCIAIINRANPALIDLMLYYIDQVPTHRGPTFELARDLASQLLENCKELADHDPVYKDVQVPTGPHTEVTEKGELKYYEEPRPACRKLEQYVLSMANASDLTKDSSIDARGQLAEIFKNMEVTKDVQAAYEVLKARIASPELPAKGMREGIVPYLHLKSRKNETWNYDQTLTGTYLNVLEKGARDGITYANKMVLLTGAGKGSIGVKILEGLLSGGAKIIVTTSRFSKETSDFYQSIYSRFGSKDSALVVVPFNQASKNDVKSLVQYIYDAKTGLGWDLDFIIPFAAIPEGGMQIDGIDSKSELAHRLMLTNLLRLLGEVKTQKEAIASHTRPSQVILPLSPNHGTFGSDGLYSESKISLETLFNRWHSENWGEYLTICGAVIGWTRGTGLMSQNNIVAEGIEALGVRTFSQSEMAFNILGLMAPAITNICQQSPVWADLNGGMQFIPGIKEHLGKLRKNLMDTSELRRAVALETSLEHKVVNGPNADASYRKQVIEPRANLRFSFPELTRFEDLPNRKLANLLDLERVPVITGFAEVGPYGNSRTRWEMEAYGTFSLEGSIEMAWIMGLIKYHNGNIKGKPYSGWIDTKSKEPVEEIEIKNKYESYITEHTGIRLVEPDILSYDPNKKQFLQEVIIEHDLEPFEASKEGAENFRHEQGDKVEVFPIPDSDQWTVRFLKGARILIPKALQYNRLVAGQVPTGWDARRYGVPDDICDQVDRVTLYGLVATVEALLSAGITDPYEFYKYVHVSEVANCSGSGMGGMTAMRKMFKDRYIDKDVQNDILQESFINTMSAWVNMLLLSSSGPLRTPVAACATAVESVDSGVDLIKNGTARIVIVGGYDDIGEEGVHEFGNMKATSDSIDEIAHGRTPREMSRPTTTTRSGFMESHGSGIQVMMNAKLAIEMGVPIYGIVGLTSMASDSIGRSVPAPGKGVMTVAREIPSVGPYPILDIDYRRKQLERRRRQIKQWLEDEFEDLKALSGLTADDYAEREKLIRDIATRQEREAMYTWGNDFYRNDPKIAPLRGALAAWGLSIDDIGLSSFHGTSTKANDKNESAAIHDMLTHLGRSKGNPVLGVFQKYLTGHPKGAAGAWMLNGVLQSLNTGIVPGNRNADNIDAALEQFDRILYPSISLQTYGIKAATVTSFGFGQKGGIVMVIHPDYLFSTIDKSTYETYAAKVRSRQSKVYRYIHNAMCTETMFMPKDKAPYTKEQEIPVYLNPTVRVENDSFKFAPQLKTQTALSASQLVSTMDPFSSVGVDAELLSAIDISNETFIQRNFTEEEQKYCSQAADPRASYTGTWSAKEAVFKSLKVPSQGGGAPLKEIEILRDSKGPSVKFHGTAAKLAGSKNVSVSITHNDFQAVAVAICK